MDDTLRKSVVIGILLLVAVIFVSGFGEIFTGNVVAGVTEVEVGLGESVRILGKDISLEKISASSEERSTVTNKRNYQATLHISGLRGYVKLGKTERIGELKIKFLDVTFPRSENARVRLMVSKIPGTSSSIGILDFPFPFLRNGMRDSCIVISDHATELEKDAAKKVADSMNTRRRDGPLVVKESQIKNSLCGRSLIIINKDAKNYCGVNCVKVSEGEGSIQFLSTSLRPLSGNLIISGYSDYDVMKAAIVIAHQNDFYKVESNSAIVTGELSNDYSLQVEELGTVHKVNILGRVTEVNLVNDKSTLLP